MAKKKKHLQFYIEYAQKQEMPNAGLCCCSWCGLLKEDILVLFKPDWAAPFSYWASRRKGDSPYIFNSLRQTIVLFMACMNGEL